MHDEGVNDFYCDNYGEITYNKISEELLKKEAVQNIYTIKKDKVKIKDKCQTVLDDYYDE